MVEAGGEEIASYKDDPTVSITGTTVRCSITQQRWKRKKKGKEKFSLVIIVGCLFTLNLTKQRVHVSRVNVEAIQTFGCLSF